jgi:hypothetical protein
MKRYIRAAVTDWSSLSYEDKLDMAADPTMPADALCMLYEMSDSSTIAHAIAANPNTPLDLLEQIADTNDVDLHKSLSYNPNITKSILDKLANTDNYGLQYRIAENPTTSAKTLRKLVAHNTSWDVLQKVVLNPNATKSIIISALKKDSGIMDAVLENPHISADFLQELATNPSSHIRGALAKTVKDPTILTQLASDPDYYVRTRVAENWNTPKEVIRQLMSDSEWLVAHCATDTYRFRFM